MSLSVPQIDYLLNSVPVATSVNLFCFCTIQNVTCSKREAHFKFLFLKQQAFDFPPQKRKDDTYF